MRVCKTCKERKVNSEFERPERERVALSCYNCKAINYEKNYGGVCKELISKRLGLNSILRIKGDMDIKLSYEEFENIKGLDDD